MPIKTIEVETYIPPIDLYLDEKIASFQQRLDNSPAQLQIMEACKRIQRKTRQKTKHRLTKTTGERRKEWASSRTSETTSSAKKIVLEKWRERQNLAEKPGLDPIWHPPDKKVLKLHKNLRKAESTALIQLRTGRIGLAWFLSKRRVPEFVNRLGCRCGAERESPRHVLLECKDGLKGEEAGRGREEEFQAALNTPEGASRAAVWIIKSGRLGQFQVASSLLYE